MKTQLTVAAMVAWFTAATASAVYAQTAVDLGGDPRVNLGPLGLTPAFQLSSLGVDNNVFNEAHDPKQDVTGTLLPSLDAVVRARRFAVRAHSAVGLVYFRRYANERAVNLNEDLVAELRLHRVTPFATAQYLNARERPSAEIDTRVRRRARAVSAGIQAAASSRLTLRFEASRQTTDYDDDAAFEAARLREQLNETADSLNLSIQYALTPLTRFVVAVQHQRDRFAFTPLRDAATFRVSPGLEFAPTALIHGHASVGIRSFDIADGRVPDFTGVVAAVDLGYTYRDTTQFEIRADRDVAYSFSPLSPYYLQTSVSGSVTHRFSRAWDASASAGRQLLAYRAIAGAALPSTEIDPTIALNGTGWSFMYAGAIGFHLARGSRLSLNIDYSARPAGIGGTYQNLRCFTTVSYGF